jgi:hypothetical protein
MDIQKSSEEYIAKVWNQLDAQVRKAVLTGTYRSAVNAAVTGTGLDEEGIATLQLEVLFVLLGAQSVQEFEEELENHPALAVGQGKMIANRLRKTIFAELALYIPGMEDADGGQAIEKLGTSIDGDVEIRTRLAKLPEGVQSTVQSPQLEEAFAFVQKKHGVAPEVAQMLGNQIVRVMVGLTTMNDFKVSVTRVAGIAPNNLDTLFADVEQTLFRPVRTAILGALQKNMGSLPGQSAPTVDPYRTPTK